MNARSWAAQGLVAGVATVCSLASAGAQPSTRGEQPPAPAPPRAAASQTWDNATLRKWIDERLNDHKQGIKRLEEASKKLESGGDPAAIGKELLEAFRDNRRAGGGGGAGGAGGNNPRPAGGRPSEYDMASGPRLNAEDRAKVRALLDEKHPALLQKIVQLGANSPEMTDRLIDGVGGRMRWIESMREKEPEEFQLRVEEVSTGLDVMKLVSELTDARKKGDASKESVVRTRLRATMASRFDTRQKLSKLKLEQLRKQADDLEKTLAKNDQDREAVVDRRTEEAVKLAEPKAKKPEKGEAAKP